MALTIHQANIIPISSKLFAICTPIANSKSQVELATHCELISAAFGQLGGFNLRNLNSDLESQSRHYPFYEQLHSFLWPILWPLSSAKHSQLVLLISPATRDAIERQIHIAN